MVAPCCNDPLVACSSSAWLRVFAPTALSPVLDRMLIDVDLPPGPGVNLRVLVDRPPSGVVSLGALWLGFPNLTPNIITLPGVELWTNSSSPVTFASVPINEPLVVPMGALPSVTTCAFTVQFISLWVAAPYCSNPAFQYAASPALVFGY